MKTYKVIAVTLAALMLCGPVLALSRAERKEVCKIEEAILRDNFTQAKSLCDRFSSDHPRSKYSSRVEQLKAVCEAKIASPHMSSAAAVTGGAFYIVQVGVFKSASNAANLAKDLQAKGFDAAVFNVDGLYKVRAGKFRDSSNARAMFQSLSNAGYSPSVINE